MTHHRDLYRSDRVYTNTPEFVGECWICHAPIRFGQAAYVRDHFSALRSGRAPSRKVHKKKCADRARRYIERLAPPMFDTDEPICDNCAGAE